MEINKKLDIFYEAAIAAAERQSSDILEEQKKLCRESLEEYGKSRQAAEELGGRIAADKIKKEINRSISEQTFRYKKAYQDRRDQKKKELFDRVEEKLEAYRGTEGYEDFLVRQIEKAKRFAGESAMTVYISPSDSARRARLAERTGQEVAVSDEEFFGGTRAVIPSKNILIDESFAGRLAHEKEREVF